MNIEELCAKILQTYPNIVRLTPQEQVLLDAYLKIRPPPISASRLQSDPIYREELEDRRQEREKLRYMLRCNQGLAGLATDDCVAPQAADTLQSTFPTPAGATWKDISMHFVDGHTLRIMVGDISKCATFNEMGMVDRRNNLPDYQWELLKFFAQGHGKIDWSMRSASRKHKKRKEDLSKRLRDYFKIADEPFLPDGNGWIARFGVEDKA